jgi:hypothetical protein
MPQPSVKPLPAPTCALYRSRAFPSNPSCLCTALINRIRGLLSELGIVLPLKAATVRKEAHKHLEDLPGWRNKGALAFDGAAHAFVLFGMGIAASLGAQGLTFLGESLLQTQPSTLGCLHQLVAGDFEQLDIRRVRSGTRGRPVLQRTGLN